MGSKITEEFNSSPCIWKVVYTVFFLLCFFYYYRFWTISYTVLRSRRNPIDKFASQISYSSQCEIHSEYADPNRLTKNMSLKSDRWSVDLHWFIYIYIYCNLSSIIVECFIKLSFLVIKWIQNLKESPSPRQRLLIW